MKNLVIFVFFIGFLVMTYIALTPPVMYCDSYMGEVIAYPNALVCEIKIREEDSPL